MQNYYISIDLKSFYASVECQERGLNPLTTNLIVADNSRTEKTVCLAVNQGDTPYKAEDFNIKVAKRDRVTELVII